MPELIDLADDIRRARKLLHLTKAEVVRRAKVTRPTLDALEAGKPVRLKSVLAVCSVLGLRLILADDEKAA